MEGFTLSLALLDYVPVAAFGAAMVLAGEAMNNPLFMVGAGLSFLAGLMKATWKLILGLWKKDVKFLNKPFLPMQGLGWLIMLPAAIYSLFKAGPGRALAAICGMPQLIFFVIWFAMTGLMVWYKKNRFIREDARCNWTAEIINSIAQCSLLAAVISVF